jgi:hypothetical protein
MITYFLYHRADKNYLLIYKLGFMSNSKLPKYTLSHNDNKNRWDLTNDKTNKVIKAFETKEEATAGGVLKKAIRGEGSVKIEKENGKYQEERTFPRSEDPKKSKG